MIQTTRAVGKKTTHNPDHALAAVRAALEIQDEIVELNLEKKMDGMKIGVGVGINSGEMLSGNLGSQKRMEYTVIGDNVNIASRLTKVAKAGEILISKKTFDAIGDKEKELRFEPRGKAPVKGRRAHVTIYSVTRSKGEEYGDLQAQALQHYLTALRLWPDYPEALRMTVARRPVPAEKQVVQKVQPEPEIKEPPERLATEEEAPVFFEIPTVQEEPQEVVEQIAGYREHGMELYQEGRYQEALSEFNKVLSANPNDPVAKEYFSKSSFELALEFFQKKEYLAAKEQFLVSLKHNSNCQQCHVYIRRSEELFKEMHYKQGIEDYGKKQLADAVMEWELVRDVDPNYKRVDYYIKKAKDLQRKIDELKKESKEEAQE